ncbi:MAG: hypothetical protein QOD00_1704 [Blastocatellia bacterium]|jgi:hypothetical protein|nr:hypothetical protein [Blastocatellia bacterium]
MSEYGDAIADARHELAEAAPDFLPNRCTILRRTLSDDGRSGKAESYAEAASDVPCRIVLLPVHLLNMLVGESVKEQGRFNVELPYTIEILESDRLLIKGITYVISGPTNDTSDALLRVLLVTKLKAV